MKCKVTLVLLLLIQVNVQSQIDFEENVIIDSEYSTDGPSSIFTVDLDGDGNIDVITASARDNKIAWYKNSNGQVQFEKQKVITLNANNATSVFAADVDGDGFIDVLSTSNGDDKIAWYKNLDGMGNFGAQQIITTNIDHPESIIAADFDGDGDHDIAIASSVEDKIAWLENTDGQGNFGPQQIISTNADFANTVFSADLDNDGDFDVLSASGNDGKVAWYENLDGLGSFSSEIIISTNGAPTSIYVEDLDGDQDMDVLASSFTTDEIVWFENMDGQGNFGNLQIISATAVEARSVYAGDLDNDGDMDVLSASEGDRKVAWYKNLDGQGTFGSPQIVAINSYDAMEVRVTDLDNDGDLEIVSSQNYLGEVFYNENIDGLGNFSENKFITTFVDYVNSIYVVDLDGDGDKDLISASRGDDKIAWYKNDNGLGSFGVQRVISVLADRPKAVFAQDLDGDGDMDILSASRNDHKIAWYKNEDGLGNFGTQTIISTDEFLATDVFAIDLDGDNDMDVLAASSNEIVWFENLNGGATFGARQLISPVDDVIAFFSIDIDNDGDMDVVSASTDDNQIAWHENIDGLGNFNPKQIITANTDEPRDVFSIDLDGDGDVDVLSASFNDDKIAWYENLDGMGNFGTENIITASADGAFAVYAIDMDNDGDIDVLSAAYNEHTIAWYENLDGQGSFGVSQVITTNEYRANSVYAVDIDEDGDIDVFPSAQEDYENQSNLNFDKISWYENTGILAIEDHEHHDVKLYPVPTDNVLTIRSTFSIDTIEIYNNLSQLVLRSHREHSIDVSSLTHGVYFVRIIDNTGNFTFKQILKSKKTISN